MTARAAKKKTKTKGKALFKRPSALQDRPTHYCPGCGHGILHRVVAEVIDELGLRERTVAIAPVGCAVLAYNYWNFDVTEAPHGRAPAIATAIKRLLPDNFVFTYQGDGDLAAIGTSEIIHAANRGENLSVVFVNNGIYGMTGGQMAPTTLIGQKTATTGRGRTIRREGFPLKISEMLAVLPAVKYVERVSLHNPHDVLRAKKAIKKSFSLQIERAGFSLVEVLSPCPVQWQMTPLKALEWVKKDMESFYPVGVLKGC